MKKARKWMAALLTAVLLLGALPMAALAEEDVWDGAADAADFAAFKAALADEEVSAILVIGDVEVDEGTLEQPLEINKPVLVTDQGSLHLAEGAVARCDVGMGLFQYEGEPFWEPICRDMAAFLIWEDGDECRRLLFGSQPDLDEVLDGQDALSTAIFRGPITLEREIEVQELCAVVGDLTVEGGLTVGQYLHVGGGANLTVTESGALTLENKGWVEGDIELLGDVEGELGCDGEFRYPHLAVRWEDGNYDDSIHMTPYDEYELSFALMAYENGGWSYTEVVPSVPAPLTYGENENHGGKTTLLANGAAWGGVYEITCQGYSLPVYIDLPELGCYSAPSATAEHYLRELPGSPLSAVNEFYVCVDPEAWFVEEGWTVSLDARAVRYDENGGTELSGVLTCIQVSEGLWKATVTGCDFEAEFFATVSNPENGDSFELGNGVSIYPEQRLVYSAAPLEGASNDWDIPWQDAFQASLHDTLSMKARTNQDLRLYLLVYQWEAEGGKPAGWYCENVNIHQIRSEGVSVAQAKEDDPWVIRVTAQSTGTHQVIRLQEREDGEGFVENSTRGVPLTVSVSSSNRPGGSGGSSSSGTVVGNSGGKAPSGGGVYTVSAPSQITGGTVSVRPQSAGKGAAVTITVTPEDGYELDELTASAGETAVSVSRAGDGRYTFTMPGANVSVNASFRKTAEAAEETPQPDAERFADVASSAYYYDAVQWAVERGVTGGTGAGLFSPNAPCTRAQTVTFLWRAAGSPAPSSRENPFRDVDSGAYYYDAVLWAVEQGITGGTTAETFSPESTVTRGQTVVFLHRATGSPAAGGDGSFTDVPSGAYYYDAVQWAVEQGVTAGTGAGLFNPNAPCTRAQIVAFLYRGQGT